MTLSALLGFNHLVVLLSKSLQGIASSQTTISWLLLRADPFRRCCVFGASEILPATVAR
jgi:hypothetical protein